MINKGITKDYNVISSNSNALSIDALNESSNIAASNETAIQYYKMYHDKIVFKKNIAYYPCNLLSYSKDYNMPGDDCVRLIFAVLNEMYFNFTYEYSKLSKHTFRNTNSKMLAVDNGDIPFALYNLGFEIYDSNESVIDINHDKIPDGYIYRIDNDFILKKGDIIARKGHVHLYLGDGMSINSENFGWGRVYRKFPQYYNIHVINNNKKYVIELENNDGNKEYYTRVYRYIGDDNKGE